MFSLIITETKIDRQTYRRKKAAKALNTNEFDPEIIEFSEMENSTKLPVLLEKENWPKMKDKLAKIAEERIKCFKNEVNRESPLIKGEEIISDTVSCIKEPYYDCLVGTPVLKRVTNYATLYYFKQDVNVTHDGKILFSKPPKDILPTEFDTKQLTTVGHAEELIMALAKGFAGAVGGKFGSLLLNLVFQDDTNGINYTELYKNFAEIVANANTEQTINEQGGKINGVVADINTYYKIRKEHGAPKDELYKYLVDRHSSLYEAAGILQAKQFEKKGLAGFVFVAEILFCLYQEMAFEDPIATKPILSSNIKSLTKAVNDYTIYTRNLVATIINDNVNTRLSKISDIKVRIVCVHGVCKKIYYYEDKETGYSKSFEQHGKKDDPEKRCRKSHDEYYNRIGNEEKAKQTEALKWISDSVDKWQVLLKNPLPGQNLNYPY